MKRKKKNDFFFDCETEKVSGRKRRNNMLMDVEMIHLNFFLQQQSI